MSKQAQEVLLISVSVIVFLTVAFIAFSRQGSRRPQIVQEISPPTGIINSRQDNWTCFDSDENSEDGGIYTRGYVRHQQPGSGQVTAYDNCAGQNDLNEFWCYESPESSGNKVPGRIVHTCPAGCVGGVCIKSNSQIIYSSSFSYPYPVSWEEENAEFSITGAELGYITVPPQGDPIKNPIQTLFRADGGAYKEGERFYGLTFYLRIDAKKSEPIIPPMRRIIDELGGLAAPASRFIIFSDQPLIFGFIATANTTYLNRKLIFEISENWRQEGDEFLFTTGGTSNIFFTVKPLLNKDLKISAIEPRG